MTVFSGYFDGNTVKTDEPIIAKKNQKVSVTVLDEFIDEPKETFEEEQARKKAAIQAMFDWADRVHCKSTESWTREELHERGFGR